MDFARSASPAVQEQLHRLSALSPGRDILGLERIAALLARLGNPERGLPPVFHVAGTNGKGSTCAFLRAAIEAAGLRCHVYSSPHLVRFNERIRLAGALIDDDALARLLAEVLDVADGIGPSFFEVTTAAAFLAFARTPADACVIEVGLGGRLDATNVIPAPAVCGIAQLGIDHETFLGDNILGIATEKAGIAKRGAPLLISRHPDEIVRHVAAIAAAAGAPFLPEDEAWNARMEDGRLYYQDANGAFETPPPTLPGRYQARNAGLALAMLRHQTALDLPVAAMQAGVASARWPARLQRLGPGPLTALLPAGSALWLDGGHNRAAGAMVASHFKCAGEPLMLVLGMLANKDAAGLIAPFAPLTERLIAVPVPDHVHHAPEELAKVARSLGISRTDVADDLPAALAKAAPSRTVLILGSLYLAGAALAANDEIPD